MNRDRVRALERNHIRRIRFWLGVFIAGLVVSGLTAFPLETELRWLVLVLRGDGVRAFAESTHLLQWIGRVYDAVAATNAQFPFLAYGTDWLAFAHLAIAVAFVGPSIDPVKNKWVIVFGLITCAGVLPLALIAGAMRGIPLAWRMIDCGFGVFGCIPLLICMRSIRALERAG